MQTKTIVDNASIGTVDLVGEQADLGHLRAQLEYARLVQNREEAVRIQASIAAGVRTHLRHLSSGRVVVQKRGLSGPRGVLVRG